MFEIQTMIDFQTMFEETIQPNNARGDKVFNRVAFLESMFAIEY